ncbi:MAG: hypothetical protein JXR73_08825 [Candidatus Omnitrophica bacterium]|nr:hypothetical protein [Candidatus Omnitrophota bacterium]
MAFWLFAPSFFVPSLLAQTLLPMEKPVVLETEDGMILNGRIESLVEQTAVLKSIYGALNIPLQKIMRVNGDLFHWETGIIREHTAALRRDGSVIIDYLQPVNASFAERRINLLTMGNVIRICDLNGEPLDFMARKIGDLTRCSVALPDYRLPAVRVQILQTDAAVVRDGEAAYTYRYTPRTAQIFCLELTIPNGAVLLEASPEPLEQSGNIIYWREALRRQQPIEITVRLSIKE